MSDENVQFDTGEKAEAQATGADNRFAVAVAKNNEESFPVLQAFQSFLDQERERSRRRLTTLSAVFMAALVILMLVFAAFFAIFFNHVMSHNEAQQDRMLDLIARDGAPRVAPASEPAAVQEVKSEDIEAFVEKLVAERLKAASTTSAGPVSTKDAPVQSPAPEPVPPPESAPSQSASAPVSEPAPSAAEAPSSASAPRRGAVADTPSGLPGIFSPATRRPSTKPEAESRASAAPAAKPRPAKPQPSRELSQSQESKRAPAAKRPQVVSVKPVKKMTVPSGYEPDSLVVQTESGALVPLRALLPAPSASK